MFKYTATCLQLTSLCTLLKIQFEAKQWSCFEASKLFFQIFSPWTQWYWAADAHRGGGGAAGAEKEKADICSIQQLLANAVMLSCSIHVVDFLLMLNFGVGRCSPDLTWYMWPCGLSVSTRRIHRICSLKIWRGLHCRLSTRGTHLTLVLLF